MSIPIFSNLVSLVRKKASLRAIWIIPFVLQIVGAVGLVGYLSYQSGQNDVENLASQLMEEQGNRLEQYLNSYLATPHQINRMNVDAVRLDQLNLRNLPGIERHLFWQIRQFETVATIIFGSNQGEFIASDRLIGQLFIMASAPSNNTEISMYASDSLGNRGELFKQFRQPDARERPWYQAAVKVGKPTWTEIFQLGDNSGLVINATRPIYDNASNELLGVFSVNLNLNEVNRFVEGLKVGKSGEVFIVDKNGLLVANSVQSELYSLTDKQNFKRLKATDSNNYLISQTSQFLTKKLGGLNSIKNRQQLTFRIEGKQKFLQLLPYQDEFGLDWLIVVVVPKSDFMAEIYANNRITIILCVVTLIGAVGISIIIVNWITEPLLQLNTAAKKIAQGQLDETIPIQRQDEIGQLAASFADMVAQLQQSFAEIKGNESRLNQIIEAIPVGISFHDVTGQITYANQKSKELLGIEALPKAEVEQLSITYQVYQTGTQQLYPVEKMPIVRALKGEKARVEDMEIRLADRSIPLEVYGTPILDETGKITGAIAAFTDISERKLAEKIFADYNHSLEIQVIEKTESLRRSETLLKEAQQIAKIGSWSWNLVSDERWWSPQMYQMVGLNPDEYQTPPDVETTNQNIHPLDKERVNQIMRNAIERGLSYEIEFRFLRPDGSITYAFSRGIVEHDTEGHVIRFWGITQDISDRKQAEESLRRYEGIVNATADWICLIDRNYNYRVINQAYLTLVNKPSEEIVGHSVSEILGKDLFETRIKDCFAQCVAGEIVKYQAWLKYGNAESQFMDVTYSPYLEEDNTISGVVVSGRNLTQLKQVEQELQAAKEAAEEANQAKSIFLANMSHELRTPLNAILGFSQLMRHSNNLDTSEQENLDTILRSGEHLLSLINQVLDLAKIEAGRITLNPSPFDLISLLKEVQGMFQLKVQAKELQLIFDYSQDLPQYVQTDQVKLRQILINLIGNAIKFTEQGRVLVKVAASEDGEAREDFSQSSLSPKSRLTFTVKDTGFGMTQEELDKLFQAFVQTETGAKSQEGTGLGLIISQQFITLMGGDIIVSSQVGRGTTFQFDIAVSLVDASSVETKAKPRRVIALESNQPHYRILIVGDKEDNRQLLFKLLNPLGFELKEASNGKEAIKVWSNWQPQLIFMDLRMPVINGYEATRQIKATGQGKGTVIIALSASTVEPTQTHLFSAGFDDFICKPFPEAEIFQALHRHIGVRFVYEESTTVNPSPTVILQPEVLAELPTDWLTSLEQATFQGDIELILNLIEDIRPQHESIANGLTALAKNFQIRQILNLIEFKNK